MDYKNASLTDDMLAFLCDWWKGHVANSDMKYARYIKARKTDT